MECLSNTYLLRSLCMYEFCLCSAKMSVLFLRMIPVRIELLNGFPSVSSMVSHRYPAEPDRAKRVKLRLMLLGISFSTVS